MDRRAVLRRLGLTLGLGAGCSDLPRASGPRTPPSAGDRPAGGTTPTPRPVSVSDIDVRKTETENLRVVVTVTNRTVSEQTRSLRVWVDLGDRRSERTESVTVPPEDETEVAVEFDDVTYDEFSGSGTVNARIR